MNAIPPDPPIEYVGKARAFIAQMGKASLIAAPQMDKVAAYGKRIITRRRRGRLAFRPECLIEIEKQWRAIPGEGRLLLDIHRTKKTLSIRDYRVSTTAVRYDHWGADATEMNLAVVGNQLTLEETEIRAENITIAIASLHAISRWYQRAIQPTDEMLLHDLARAAHTEIIETRERVIVETENGSWGGYFQYFLDVDKMKYPVYAIRTFVP